MRYMSLLIVIASLIGVSIGCSPESGLTGSAEGGDQGVAGKWAPVHRVVVGSPDACESWGDPTGCDGNFSLVANQFENGNVNGMWRDVWIMGDEPGPLGMVVRLNCLNVQEYEGRPIAAFSGHAIKADPEFMPVGQLVRGIARDLGNAEGDPNDEISYALYGGARTCMDIGDGTDRPWEWFDTHGYFLELVHGQVRIW